jgi:hypothetical protein
MTEIVEYGRVLLSFLPLFAGNESDYPQRDFLYWEQGSLGRNVQSVLLDERFFALRMNPGKPVRVFEIFDDPGCKQDLAAKRQDLVKRAEKLFVSNRTENPWYINLTDAIKKSSRQQKQVRTIRCRRRQMARLMGVIINGNLKI